MIPDNIKSAAANEYSAGFQGTPWITWGLFFMFAVFVVLFALSVDQIIRSRV